MPDHEKVKQEIATSQEWYRNQARLLRGVFLLQVGLNIMLIAGGLLYLQSVLSVTPADVKMKVDESTERIEKTLQEMQQTTDDKQAEYQAYRYDRSRMPIE